MSRKFTDEELQLLLNQGLSQAEIAREVGVSEQAVSSRVKRLKGKLADRFVQEVDPDPVSLKEKLSPRELKFIENHLVAGLTIEKAMKSAGYINYHPKYIYVAARKIIEKYDQQAGDHRKIMRAMGYGETRILQMLIDSAENAKSEIVRLNARIALAKCLGLQKEAIEGGQGLTVIIKGPDYPNQPSLPQRPPLAALPGPEEESRHPKPIRPGMPVQIFR